MRSCLEIHTLSTGDNRVIHQTEKLIEAPNWSPDGQYLLINGEGLLYKVPLQSGSRAPAHVETDFATKCNNDHGISPDGQNIVISDQSENDDRSCIYILPSDGGKPSRITQNTPSWWHGWSPDGNTLAYTAQREGKFYICTIPVTGGGESQIIGGDGSHYDGPDYSPDGEWIWFNSTRSGTMQLWRVRTDGTDAEQMTDDERVNWFPHPSPDGNKLLYLAYENGVDGHPRDLDVELRIMDLTTKTTHTAVSLFGGQGSINVPCWSPDSNEFAFVRYYKP